MTLLSDDCEIIKGGTISRSVCVHVFEYNCEHVCVFVRMISDRGRIAFDLNPRGLISSQLSGTLSTQTTVLKVVRAPYGTGDLSLQPARLLSTLSRLERHGRYGTANTCIYTWFQISILDSRVGRHRSHLKKFLACLGGLREPKAAQHSMLHVTRLATLPVFLFCF